MALYAGCKQKVSSFVCLCVPAFSLAFCLLQAGPARTPHPYWQLRC
jgi:hypothetical protein